MSAYSAAMVEYSADVRRTSAAIADTRDRHAWFTQLHTDRYTYWEFEKHQLEQAVKHAHSKWLQDKVEWETASSLDSQRWSSIREAYLQGTTAAGVTAYFQLCLDAMAVPGWFERDYKLTFAVDDGILLVDLRIPDFASLEFLKPRELKAGPKDVPLTIRERQALTEKLTALLPIKFMREVQQLDHAKKLKLIACNGFVIRDDPATGHKRSDVILSVATTPEALSGLNLARIDPAVCFRSLKGVAGARLSELVPVKPVLSFDHDRRIVASRDVITSEATNLAAIDWQDFEHLIRELFEKEFGGNGVEVRVTQASRDRGVDAIAFDPDPIRGGKFVIQAKRYTNTVDVAAVRDLFGTVVNEGANRGILVTTSSFGRDSFEFAKDKPLTLISGNELLHLLGKHGYAARIDIDEAKRLARDVYPALRGTRVHPPPDSKPN